MSDYKPKYRPKPPQEPWSRGHTLSVLSLGIAVLGATIATVSMSVNPNTRVVLPAEVLVAYDWLMHWSIPVLFPVTGAVLAAWAFVRGIRADNHAVAADEEMARLAEEADEAKARAKTAEGKETAANERARAAEELARGRLDTINQVVKQRDDHQAEADRWKGRAQDYERAAAERGMKFKMSESRHVHVMVDAPAE